MSLSTNLARVLSRKALPPGPKPYRSSLPPRRLPLHRMTEVGEGHRAPRAVQAALARWVDEERPLAPVERMAAAGANRDQPMLSLGEQSSIPGNDPGGHAEQLALDLAVRRKPAVDAPEVRALDLMALRVRASAGPIFGPESGVVPAVPGPEVDLGSCVACGGALRVAVVDLAGGSAALECIACGLRRIESDGSAGDTTSGLEAGALGSPDLG
jgi:hypothetical protein